MLCGSKQNYYAVEPAGVAFALNKIQSMDYRGCLRHWRLRSCICESLITQEESYGIYKIKTADYHTRFLLQFVVHILS